MTVTEILALGAFLVLLDVGPALAEWIRSKGGPR